ncbi:hypothetical protein [Saccharolobus islandicus]|uniref:hypothetical protein n=1 Tax=Saccharolobus islandicus TaxID=43080 RepID=UPI000A99F92D|nr:hypothetical protein [Sulfolobus islandicus]
MLGLNLEVYNSCLSLQRRNLIRIISKPNLKIGIPILSIAVILVIRKFLIHIQELFAIGFLIAILSLVFFPRRRKWA